MSNGKVVITSADKYKVQKAKTLLRAEYNCSVIGDFSIQEKPDAITWKFHHEEEAIRHANIFMNMGFEYVQRI